LIRLQGRRYSAVLVCSRGSGRVRPWFMVVASGRWQRFVGAAVIVCDYSFVYVRSSYSRERHAKSYCHEYNIANIHENFPSARMENPTLLLQHAYFSINIVMQI
jgi:hypothetical protein